MNEESFGGFYTNPVPILELQKRLTARGIEERVDLLIFHPAGTSFGIIDYQGQTRLIPLQDEYKLFPELDFTSDCMYSLDEMLPLLHERSKQLIADIQRQNRERPSITASPSLAPYSLSRALENSYAKGALQGLH